MNSLLTFVFFVSLIVYINGADPCYWTGCTAWNETKCGEGDIEKQSTVKCGGFLSGLVNKRKAYCCDPKRCGYQKCIPDGCQDCVAAACSAGTQKYPEAGTENCKITVDGMELTGKRHWCCSP